MQDRINSLFTARSIAARFAAAVGAASRISPDAQAERRRRSRRRDSTRRAALVLVGIGVVCTLLLMVAVLLLTLNWLVGFGGNVISA